MRSHYNSSTQNTTLVPNANPNQDPNYDAYRDYQNNVHNYDIVKFVNMCNAGQINNTICNDTKIWKHFIMRDFNTVYIGSDPKEAYTLLHNQNIRKYYKKD